MKKSILLLACLVFCFQAVSQTGFNKLLGGTDSDRFNDLQPTSDGGYILAGESPGSNTGTLIGYTRNGACDYWVVKMNNAGYVQWQRLLEQAITTKQLLFYRRPMAAIS